MVESKPCGLGHAWPNIRPNRKCLSILFYSFLDNHFNRDTIMINIFEKV